MRSSTRGLAAVAAAALAVTMSACNGSGDGAGKAASQGPGAGSKQAALGRMAPADAGDQGDPVKGGTLRLAGKGDVDHLDTASAYYAPSWALMRAFTRQLVSYPNDPDLAPDGKANVPVADMAVEVPKPTDGGRTYTFHIKQGVRWHAPGGDRQVTSADFLRGFERLCNPVQPSGALGYYADNIVGMQRFCDGFGKVAPTAAAIKAYLGSHTIPGIRTPDPATLEFHLVAPVADFLNILALPFSSAAPVEYLDYVPDSPQFRRHTISDGPYLVSSYKAKRSIRLDRNPAWDPATDSLRKAYVDTIQVTEGVSEESIAQQLQAGSLDLNFNNQFPVAEVRKAQARHDPKLGYAPTGDVFYLVLNLLSPNSGGALKKVAVRQALNYAVDKRHVIQQLGGPSIAAPIDTILTPTLLGFRDVHPYGTRPDVAKAKRLLAEAGYPNGLTLKYMYATDNTRAVQLFTVLQQDMAAAGIRLKGVPVATSDQFYATNLPHPPAAKNGTWDVAMPGWLPDWNGNGARSFFVPLLDGRHYGEGTTNYGDYDSTAVNDLVTRAFQQTDRAKEAAMLAQADAMVMKDAPWVPLYTEFYATYHSQRLHGYVYFPMAFNADLTNVWLAS